MRRTVVAVVLAGALALGACGGDGQAIDAKGAELLATEVRLAREAVANGDMNRAGEMLNAVEQTVAGLRAQDKISDRRAANILAALGDVKDGVRAWFVSTMPETTAPPSTEAPVITPTEDDDGDNDNDDDGGRGRGKGRKHDD